MAHAEATARSRQRARAATDSASPAKKDSPLRVLIAAHSDPHFTKGGAEIAAHQLFAALQERSDYEPWFLGCVRDQFNQKLGATISQPFSEREYLYSAGSFDWFKFSNEDAKFPGAFRALIESLRPQIAHFHHYINFGVEAFFHVRTSLPNCRIVLTLHEYLALCNHFGQMVTTKHRTLCYEATPIRCTACFNEITPSDFFLRKIYIRRFFDLVDHFIAPSNFLAERYVAWGIPRAKISVIENVIPSSARSTRTEPRSNGSGPLRVGFFGQISVLKGISVLLDAAALLEKRGEYGIVFEIFGDYSNQPPEFQTDFLARLEKAGHNVVFHGPYDQNRVDQLMHSVDLVLTPSIWWENSPVVIQEALRNRRPIVCSDIGGMAEKVRDGLDGFHFPVGNCVALVSLLLKLAEAPERLAEIANTMRRPGAAGEITSQHERLYASLLS
jgi:glycosyltransferase involved in cell wall biosynthesis